MASSSRTAGRAPPKSPESFESLATRNAAAETLQSYEKLSWFSFQRCESLTQTRLHFQNIIAGFTEEDEAALQDWKIDNTPHPSKAGEEQQSGGKGKKRIGSGGGGGDVVAGSSSREHQRGREKSTSSGGARGSDKKKKKRSGGEELG